MLAAGRAGTGRRKELAQGIVPESSLHEEHLQLDDPKLLDLLLRERAQPNDVQCDGQDCLLSNSNNHGQVNNDDLPNSIR